MTAQEKRSPNAISWHTSPSYSATRMFATQSSQRVPQESTQSKVVPSPWQPAPSNHRSTRIRSPRGTIAIQHEASIPHSTSLSRRVRSSNQETPVSKPSPSNDPWYSQSIASPLKIGQTPHLNDFRTRRPGQEQYIPVYLNVYKFKLSVPLSAYHSAVEVGGQEYSFAGQIGVYVCAPGGGDEGNGMDLKERRLMGYVSAKQEEIHRYMKTLAANETYAAKNYDVLARNCNHFAEDCIKGLHVEKKPPTYINALARNGQRLRCLVPAKYIGEDPTRNGKKVGWREAFCTCR